ncbi:MAG: hypothetical protein IJL05_03745 [Alphaproteobacteria bacterium]|nr:hypothetical protein [Alphaproteobacteria bacterium]
MLKQNYVGMVDFHGTNWARIGGTDLSQMTGAKGVDKLIFDGVTGLQGRLCFLGVKTIEFIDTNVSGIKSIICDTNCKIKGLTGNQSLSGLIIYEYAGPINPATKLIKDYINNKPRQ